MMQPPDRADERAEEFILAFTKNRGHAMARLADHFRQCEAETVHAIAAWLRDDAQHEPLSQCEYSSAILREDAAAGILGAKWRTTSAPNAKRNP